MEELLRQERNQKIRVIPDTSYPMHGSIPVKPDIVGKLIEGAEQIRRGEAAGTEINLFGNYVILYKFSYAGFLCEAN